MEYTVHTIAQGVYHLEEKDRVPVFMTLLVGSEKALLFDTGWGTGDIRGTIAGITALPVTTVLSHHHLDHSFGAWQMDEAWIHPRDLARCVEFNSWEERAAAWDGTPFLQGGETRDEYAARGCCPLRPLEQEQVFDLGGMTARVVEMPGHTQGSIGLLVPERRLLLVGDAANPTLWMFFEESSPLIEYAATLDRVMQLPFDRFLIGHRSFPYPREEMARFARMAREANVAQSHRVEPFPDFPTPVYRYGIGTEGEEDYAYILFTERQLVP